MQRFKKVDKETEEIKRKFYARGSWTNIVVEQYTQLVNEYNRLREDIIAKRQTEKKIETLKEKHAESKQ